MIYSLIDQRRNHIIQNASNKCKHVCLETVNVNTMGCGITIEEKALMLVEGFNQGKAFLDKLFNGTYIGPKIPPKLHYEYPTYFMLESNIEDSTESVEILNSMVS